MPNYQYINSHTIVNQYAAMHFKAIFNKYEITQMKSGHVIDVGLI